MVCDVFHNKSTCCIQFQTLTLRFNMLTSCVYMICSFSQTITAQTGNKFRAMPNGMHKFNKFIVWSLSMHQIKQSFSVSALQQRTLLSSQTAGRRLPRSPGLERVAWGWVRWGCTSTWGTGACRGTSSPCPATWAGCWSSTSCGRGFLYKHNTMEFLGGKVILTLTTCQVYQLQALLQSLEVVDHQPVSDFLNFSAPCAVGYNFLNSRPVV